MSIPFLTRNVPAFDDHELISIVEDRYGRTGAVRRVESERDVTAVVTAEDGSRVVLKVSNEAEEPDVVDLQVAALRWIEHQDPGLAVPQMVPTSDGRYVTWVDAADGTRHLVRMVTHLPGTVLEDVPELSTVDLRRNLGSTMARLDRALRGFHHRAAGQRHPWVVMGADRLMPYAVHIPDDEARKLVERVLTRFTARVVPAVRALRHQVIHQDAHIGNLLVDAEDPDRIVGIFDFGDMVHGPLIAELAVAADPDHAPDDPVGVIEQVSEGFDRILPLESEEVGLIGGLVEARLAATVVIMAARAALAPEEPAYTGDLSIQVGHLDRLVSAAPIHQRLRRTLHFPSRGVDTSRLMERRTNVLGDGAPTFYTRPLHVESSRGMWLVGADGTRYLDFYNNVPQVGHGHPAIVNAVARQVAELNTNSRYAFAEVVEYGEKLTATLGDHLDVCLFVNSGSEANDVALQIARTVTGQRGVVITENAYHGVTAATREVSPSGAPGPTSDWIIGVGVPNPFRDRAADLAERCLADVARAVSSLASRGLGTAAFLVDCGLCSDGLPSVPEGYLAQIASIVHAAGGLVIADEVQTGFGRLGGMWGHEVRSMRPDIVTMGKPVGNGFPLGVVVTSQEVLGTFNRARRLFSTFGGNPVAAAAGSAVLSVIASEGLVERAATMGGLLVDRLHQVAEHHPIIGDVRGRGLLVGVELVTGDRLPASGETAAVVETLRERGVLAGSDGPDRNVLKLRPPLIVEPEHIERFSEALDAALASVGRHQ